jgi:hypothetical protein
VSRCDDAVSYWVVAAIAFGLGCVPKENTQNTVQSKFEWSGGSDAGLVCGQAVACRASYGNKLNMIAY